MPSDTMATSQVVARFFGAIGKGDGVAIMDCLSADIVFELPINSYNRVIPYMGTRTGHAQVAEAFRIRAETTQVLEYALRGQIVQDDKCCAVIYTKARERSSGREFEIEDSHHLVVDNGKIVRWKVYFDPNPEVAAFNLGLPGRLIAAVAGRHADEVKAVLDLGAQPNTRDQDSGLTALMMAAGRGDADVVRLLLLAGADVHAVDARAGTSPLHKACQGGNAEVVRLLLDAGAFIDIAAATTGHTPLFDALWYKFPSIIQLLLDRGAGLGYTTHYGFNLQQHINFERSVNVFGKERFAEAEAMVTRRRQADAEKQEHQPLMRAVVAGDLAKVRTLVEQGAKIDERWPVLNGFNDRHTPLLVACRDGHNEIAAELVKAGADVNAVDPVFGAVPLHKAVYNGHTEITQMLVRQPRIDLNFVGGTNGYTPLHDAIWHGFAPCALALIQAGARTDIPGHDGKQPVDIAREVFKPGDSLIEALEAR